MPLDELRIVRETAECLRARPESDAALKRRNEWIQTASAHHSLNQVADAAGLPPQELDRVLQALRGEAEPEERRAAAGLWTRFRSSTA